MVIWKPNDKKSPHNDVITKDNHKIQTLAKPSKLYNIRKVFMTAIQKCTFKLNFKKRFGAKDLLVFLQPTLKFHANVISSTIAVKGCRDIVKYAAEVDIIKIYYQIFCYLMTDSPLELSTTFVWWFMWQVYSTHQGFRKQEELPLSLFTYCKWQLDHNDSNISLKFES